MTRRDETNLANLCRDDRKLGINRVKERNKGERWPSSPRVVLGWVRCHCFLARRDPDSPAPSSPASRLFLLPLSLPFLILLSLSPSFASPFPSRRRYVSTYVRDGSPDNLIRHGDKTYRGKGSRVFPLIFADFRDSRWVKASRGRETDGEGRFVWEKGGQVVSGKLWDLWVSEFKIFMRIVSLSPSLSLFLNRFTRIGNSEGSIYSISVLYPLSASTNCDRIRWSNISQDLENFQTIAPMLENLLEILKISRENRTSSISWMGGHFLNPFINESTSCRSEKYKINRLDNFPDPPTSKSKLAREQSSAKDNSINGDLW